MGKHVIILGAGASYTSGYPLAADLRVILSSTEAFKKYVEGKTSQHNQKFRDKLLQLFAYNEPAIRLFREGGFATVDEFSFLARKRLKTQVANMKRLMTVVLALHNPETEYKKNGANTTTTGFESSDYYPFVQKLFSSDLHGLRADMTVLSYNYDSYLDFLLYRALSCRKNVAGQAVISDSVARVTSGFDQRNANALKANDEFCLLKLHGTSAVPLLPVVQGQPNEYLTYREVFLDQKFFHTHVEQLSALDSPVFFPWELIGEDGKILPEQEFREHEQAGGNNLDYSRAGKLLYPICRAIWERARQEICKAETISFVGMSFHHFLKGGFEFLFGPRGNHLPNLVFVDPQCLKTKGGVNAPIVERARRMLTQASPSILGGTGSTNMRFYDTFANFIQEEMA